MKDHRPLKFYAVAVVSLLLAVVAPVWVWVSGTLLIWLFSYLIAWLWGLTDITRLYTFCALGAFRAVSHVNWGLMILLLIIVGLLLEYRREPKQA